MPTTTVATNRRAYHEYFVEDKIEAGIVLVGPEVKSVRAHQVSLGEAYASIDAGELWIHGMRIAPYKPATRENVEPARPRKLLLRRSELGRLARQVREKGFTLIPLRMYFGESGYAKIELGLCRGKRQYDKREAIAERDYERRKQQALSERRD
jgi:SsrA-binding protein